MANIRDLRRRIKSIKNIQQITKAMKAVSAGRMRRAQESVLAARPFAKRVRDVLGRVGSASAGMKHPLLAVREPKKVAFIVVTADRGLCGGFNANIIKKAVLEMKLMDRQREIYLADIIDYFTDMANKGRNISDVKATSAVELSGEEKKKLAAAMAKCTGKQVRLSYDVDPKLLGGVVVRVGDKVIDGSVIARLQTLREHLRQIS